jgi:hypothetical protein
MTAKPHAELRDLYHFGQERQRAARVLASLGAVGVLLALVFSFFATEGLRQFAFSYLLSYCYFLSLALGALCLVLVSHLTRSGWNVVWRRLAELMAATLPCWALLFLPILAFLWFGGGALFHWNDPAVMRDDPLIREKVPYLNAGFFTLRAVVYLAIWSALASYYYRNSRLQDHSGDKQLTLRMQKWSGPALVVFGFTVTFASFDWLMSLDAHWFSTIFGVYFFGGTAVGAIAALILAAQYLQHRGLLKESITVEHYHDLGKLLFGFVFFWGYIAFSQYMLIWYANIPEETQWFLIRQTGGWAGISLILLFGHFLLPFAGLMSRHVRRNRILLGGWAAWLLVMHWLDLYWLVMPQLSKEAGPTFGLVDLCCLIGLGSLYVSSFLWAVGDHALIPVRDPRLAESLAFENT